jgi:hypothetical protein
VSTIFVVNFGCSPHLEQRGEVGSEILFFHAAQNAENTLRAS